MWRQHVRNREFTEDIDFSYVKAIHQCTPALEMQFAVVRCLSSFDKVVRGGMCEWRGRGKKWCGGGGIGEREGEAGMGHESRELAFRA